MLCPTMPPSVAVKKDADVVGAIGWKLLVKLLVLYSFGLSSTAGMHVFVEWTEYLKRECYRDKCGCTTCHGLCDVFSSSLRLFHHTVVWTATGQRTPQALMLSCWVTPNAVALCLRQRHDTKSGDVFVCFLPFAFSRLCETSSDSY